MDVNLWTGSTVTKLTLWIRTFGVPNGFSYLSLTFIAITENNNFVELFVRSFSQGNAYFDIPVNIVSSKFTFGNGNDPFVHLSFQNLQSYECLDISK